MNFTKEEIETIQAAIKAKRITKLIKQILIISLVFIFFALFFDYLDTHVVKYLLIPFFIMIVASPLAPGPMYDDLVDILEKHLPDNLTSHQSDNAN